MKKYIAMVALLAFIGHGIEAAGLTAINQHQTQLASLEQ